MFPYKFDEEKIYEDISQKLKKDFSEEMTNCVMKQLRDKRYAEEFSFSDQPIQFYDASKDVNEALNSKECKKYRSFHVNYYVIGFFAFLVIVNVIGFTVRKIRARKNQNAKPAEVENGNEPAAAQNLIQ
jgi:flagellar biosynthesis/type III secretory pathway M-ring protein FliF/YscJ